MQRIMRECVRTERMDESVSRPSKCDRSESYFANQRGSSNLGITAHMIFSLLAIVEDPVFRKSILRMLSTCACITPEGKLMYEDRCTQAETAYGAGESCSVTFMTKCESTFTCCAAYL